MKTVWLLFEHGVPIRVCLTEPEIRDWDRYGKAKIRLAPGDEIFGYQMATYKTPKERKA